MTLSCFFGVAAASHESDPVMYASAPAAATPQIGPPTPPTSTVPRAAAVQVKPPKLETPQIHTDTWLENALQQRDAFVLPGVDMDLEAYGAHGQPRPPHWAPTLDIDLLGWQGGFLFIGEAKTDVRRFDVPTVTDAAELASFVGADLLVLTAPNDLEPQQREALSAEVGDKGLQMEFLVVSQLLS